MSSVRNCGELGVNLQKICSRLLANDELVKLLYYTDTDPFSQEPLSNQQKNALLNDLICVVPKVGARTDSRSVIAIYIPRAVGVSSNTEFRSVEVAIEVFVPLSQWIIKDTNFRPFAILGEIQKSLNHKSINGLGTIEGGDFELTAVTNEMSTYRQIFTIVEYE